MPLYNYLQADLANITLQNANPSLLKYRYISEYRHILHRLFLVFSMFFISKKNDWITQLKNKRWNIIVLENMPFITYYYSKYQHPINNVKYELERRKERGRWRKKELWRCIKALITTSLLLLKKFWQDESNNTNKSYQWWPEWVYLSSKTSELPFIFRRQMWSIKIIIGDIYWYCCFRLMEIFMIILVMS